MRITGSRLTAAAHSLLFAFALAVVAGSARAQPAPRAAHPSLAGAWRGTSTCTPQSGPACHNEVVVYHLRELPHASADAGDRLEWLANKIVAGNEEEMGTLACGYDRLSGIANCPMRNWMWRFALSGDTLTGTLTDPASVVWRNVRVVRAR